MAAFASGLGLDCASSFGPAGFPDGYELSCNGVNEGTHTQSYLSAIYWTTDSTSYLDLSVLSDFGSASTPAPSAVSDAIEQLAALAGGDAAREWAASMIDDPSCVEGCFEEIAGARYQLHVGVSGGAELNIAALPGGP